MPHSSSCTSLAYGYPEPNTSTFTSDDDSPATTTQDELSAYGWPVAFLDDFESKIWLTYRSNFCSIPKSDDQNAASSMTLGVRLRSQLMDSQGFTSDTGWGCMIRSGQSLLANALSILHLGRGIYHPFEPDFDVQSACSC